jgi:maltooligosyltrehalose synthase
VLSDSRVLFQNEIKIGLLSRLLRFRREHPKLCSQGDYLPLSAGSLFAFARRSDSEVCISIARTSVAPKAGTDASEETVILPDQLVGGWRSVLTGRSIELGRSRSRPDVPAAQLIAAQPCELLIRTSP